MDAKTKQVLEEELKLLLEQLEESYLPMHIHGAIEARIQQIEKQLKGE